MFKIDELSKGHSLTVVTYSLFKERGLNVRIADEAERGKLRAMTYPKAREAYVEMAGPGGKEMVELYEKELAALSK